MDIRQLQYFLEVAKHKSFSNASKSIHISQPTLSKMIKGLEEELGVVLFNRSTRAVELTEAGQVVQLHAQAVSQAMENLQSAVADLSELRAGSFSLGLPPVIGASFFPKVIMEFRRLYPQVTIKLTEEGGKQIEQRLLAGELDLGVVVLPVDGQLFETVPIVNRHLKLVVPLDHQLAHKRKAVLADLKDEPFILFRQEFSLHERVKEACIAQGFTPNIAFESSQWDFIYELVCAGQGVSFLPETICARMDKRKVAVIHDVEPPINWNLGVIWKKDSYLSHAAKEWIQYAKKVF
ncbi:LysR family transcriptional regulator [Paenibacillus sp. IITD108]|uniref:LysR family transcriptional regulator n=1 Tax=Paenibacillus sp. IITD108 TaxID=3116649 RepID=UPI002F4175A1